MEYKTIDLCAGIGGIRRGFEMTKKFKNVLSAEIDDAACATYEHLFNENPKNDLTSEKFKKLVVQTDYDVLLAGFPCQAFSRIGKKLGFRDATRGTIFFDIADIISRTNPRAIFLENVDNLVSHDEGNTIATIIRTLEDELEYRVIGVTIDEDGNYVYNRSSLVRNSKDFGVPQNRPRAYIMAFSKRKYGNAIKLLNDELPLSNEKVIFKDVNSVLEQDVDDHYYMAQGYLDTLKKHKERNHDNGNGFGYCVVNKNNGTNPIAYTLLATGGSGKERNLIYQPKNGVAGKKLPRKKTVLNSEGIRVMTPVQWGRLQGFIGYGFLDDEGTEHFSFPEKTTDVQKYKQFGNSVSIPVIESMAEFMIKCFEKLENEQIDVIYALAENNEFFTKKDVMELLGLNQTQAGNILKKLVDKKTLARVSKGKTTRYVKYRENIQLSPYSYEEKVMQYAKEFQVITNKEVQNLLEIPAKNANVLLSNMTNKGLLFRMERGKYTSIS